MPDISHVKASVHAAELAAMAAEEAHDAAVAKSEHESDKAEVMRNKAVQIPTKKMKQAAKAQVREANEAKAAAQKALRERKQLKAQARAADGRA